MAAYYNEIDPYAAEWLRNLIKAGHIAPGDVDTRSIVDVRADDLKNYDQCHFFAGIGGWSLALRLAGWPDERPVWTGSCPCQPFSAAGKQKGEADERHLWPVFAGLISERQPANVFGEQVASRLGRGWLSGVRADLETLGYAVGAADTCAAGAGAPHIRQRLYWLADAHSGQRGRLADGEGCQPNGETTGRQQGYRELERGGATGGLADANGGLTRHGHLQPSGQHGQQPQDGGAGGLEHATSDGRQQRRPEPSERGLVGGCGEDVERLGDAADARSQGRIECGNGADERSSGPSGVVGFWSRYNVVHCTDGKARRFEPGSFPLAHGVSNRVGRLRAYGNAIVPQVAAEFILAAGV